jgi:hypothetical protein
MEGTGSASTLVKVSVSLASVSTTVRVLAGCAAFTGKLQRQVLAVSAQQAQADRDHERLLDRLAGGGRAALRQSVSV